jgi:hypothetical protein
MQKTFPLYGEVSHDDALKARARQIAAQCCNFFFVLLN